MDQHEPIQPPRPRSRKRTGSKTFLITLACVILAVVFAFWYLNTTSRFSGSWFNKGGLPKSSTTVDKTLANKDLALQKTLNDQNADKDSTASVTIGKTPDEEDLSAEHQKNIRAGGGCEEECGRIDSFYAHLDEQDYIQSFKLSQPSREHFKNLIVKLSQNPPVVTRETDDLFTILKNTAHFFRVIGKHNIFLIKGILDQEKDSIEEITMQFPTILNASRTVWVSKYQRILSTITPVFSSTRWEAASISSGATPFPDYRSVFTLSRSSTERTVREITEMVLISDRP
jgi:hypothetical protein